MEKQLEQINQLFETALPKNLTNKIIKPEDRDYHYVRSSYMGVGRPEIVVMAETNQDVVDTIAYVNELRKSMSEVPFSIRSGGHGMSGSSTNVGGVILDLSKMNAIEILDEAAGIVKIQAGAQWGQVAGTLAPHDLIITSGNFGDVGVGGIATSGGSGYFTRHQGLTIDHVIGATLITADGVIHELSETSEPELFWGLRGGGTQLGVAVDFTLQAHKVNSTTHDASVIQQHITYVTEDVEQFVANWGRWIKQAPQEMTSFLMIQKTPQNVYAVDARNVWANTDTERAVPELEKALAIDKIYDHSENMMSYANLIPYPQSIHIGQQKIKIANAIVDKVDASLGRAIKEVLETAHVVELRPLDGKVHEVGQDETAWVHRHQDGFLSVWMSPKSDDQLLAEFAPVMELATGMYGAYSSITTSEVSELTWPGKTGKRLKALKNQVDPEGVFNTGLQV
ncbi:FAD-binding oxidoreductase [Vagococcus zengguangii]|uniref:FAD-binding oxidoreductase n=1 Tax=Vagococcus zengguangii TaxID=2571750 RepID=UPI001108CB08|nr:FAD-binding oxidoreductase [Vagococcus zengguangii]TLG80867.1 FAD-binding oxidoreductase [Vagococcus zengguangii]